MIDRHSLAPLRHRRFRYFLGARFSTLLGSAIAPIAVAFAVLDLTHSPSALGMVLAARTIPMVVLVLFGGVLADRIRRDVVLLTANLLCFGTQSLAAILLLTGTADIWQIAAIEAVNGAAAAFTFPALQGLMPQLVDRTELQQANALNGLSRNITMIGGGAVGGALVGFLGPGWGLAVDAVTFGVAAVLISRLRLARVPREPQQRSSTWTDLRVGWQEFVSRRWVWVIVAAFSVFNAVTAGAVQTLGPVIADETFGRVGWGLVQSAGGVGLVVGALVMLRWRPRRPLVVGMLGCGVAVIELLVLGLSPTLAPLLAIGFLVGVGTDLFGIGWETALQEHVPTERLSRVASYDMLGSLVAVPVGQLTAGPLAAVFGASDVVVGGAVVLAVVVTLTVADSSVRGLRRTPTTARVDTPA
ncbi:MFS transporter [Actinopolymorpha sp. NPDC004070]|uniref:MFS transporter n=1 Tax=Actinopolymorpha sp. NPDC004070 TaxID=3154548 RepID=UPI0033BDCC7B